MAIGILNNIPSLVAENNLGITNQNLQKTLFRLGSGSRMKAGEGDEGGLANADGLKANTTALTQSAPNANSGVGALQVADGALAQVTTLLNRAVTLATEASTGTVSQAQRGALDAEFTQIKAEIDRIGSTTTFNGTSVFTATTTSIFLSDASSTSQIGVTVGTVASASITDGTGSNAVDISSDTLADATRVAAQTAPGHIDSAIANVASIRGAIGAGINRLQSAVNV